MTHPKNAEEFDSLLYIDMCPWLIAYMSLRAIVLDRRNEATPAKHLAGGITVVEAELARRMNVPLTSLYGLIQADSDRINSKKDAQDEAGFPTA